MQLLTSPPTDERKEKTAQKTNQKQTKLNREKVECWPIMLNITELYS